MTDALIGTLVHFKRATGNLIYENTPSFVVECKQCGNDYFPNSNAWNGKPFAYAKGKTCRECLQDQPGIRQKQIPMMTAWDDMLGLPALHPTEEQLKRARKLSRDHEVGEAANCGCEPCHFDLRTTGYRCEPSDPIFRLSRCLWHLEIHGREKTVREQGRKCVVRGFIYVSQASEGKEPELCCDIGDVPALVKEHGWTAKAFHPKDIKTYADIIGAKKPKH